MITGSAAFVRLVGSTGSTQVGDAICRETSSEARSAATVPSVQTIACNAVERAMSVRILCPKPAMSGHAYSYVLLTHVGTMPGLLVTAGTA